MLTEHLIASLGVPSKPPGTNVARDAAIVLYQCQPLQQQRAVYTKSAAAQNCVAVSAAHVFAAQKDQGVVHVYQRRRGQGSPEAAVAFPERIACLALACHDALLLLGTQQGRIFLWETATGRLVATHPAHLHPVTALGVDASSNFLLSASRDGTVHVWSIPALLSFASAETAAPLRTFSSHRADVTALVLGHAPSHCNFAVSLSKDRTCLVWDYRTCQILRTFLLPAVPTCAALDPADRAVYVGYETGHVQSLDLHTTLHGAEEDAAAPRPASETSLWKNPDLSRGPVLSIDVSYDASSVITGHESGHILVWDVARGLATNFGPAALHAPVTNIQFLPVTGHRGKASTRNINITEIVKPKFAAFSTQSHNSVPANYSMHVQFTTDLCTAQSAFAGALAAPTFPTSLLDEGLSELASGGSNASRTHGDDEDDFMALDGEPPQPTRTMEQENAHLKAQIKALQNVQKTALGKMVKLGEEKRAWEERERKRWARKRMNERKDGVGRVDEDGDDSTD